MAKYTFKILIMKTRSSSNIFQRNKRKKEKEANKQLVVRFPQDIADLIHENNYNAQFAVEYLDDRHAICQIFDEEFNAILLKNALGRI